METIILDTDFETDCDDAGALCVLHALARRGNAAIAGVIASVHSPWPAAGVRALNLRLGRPDIPVGCNFDYPDSGRYRQHRERMPDRLYHRAMAEAVPEALPDRFRPEEGVALYRRLLEQAEDGSVTICAIGLLTLLAELLRQPGGRELVARKVKLLVSMANGVRPEGRPGFNWEMAPEAAAFVTAEWPTPILVSPIGGDVLTGAELARRVAADNLELLAYRKFGGGTPGFRRSSWDQLAVLAAADVLERCGFAARSEPGRSVFDPAGCSHRWTEPHGAPHWCLSLTRSPDESAAFVESFMAEVW